MLPHGVISPPPPPPPTPPPPVQYLIVWLHMHENTITQNEQEKCSRDFGVRLSSCCIFLADLPPYCVSVTELLNHAVALRTSLPCSCRADPPPPPSRTASDTLRKICLRSPRVQKLQLPTCVSGLRSAGSEEERSSWFRVLDSGSVEV